ncbi:MAG TPA: hypothetical protein VKQ28_15680 [Candidatus Acidoferrum sp.]|nr:hypothetical protein [Candidatus Acidoferrum sp.]
MIPPWRKAHVTALYLVLGLVDCGSGFAQSAPASATPGNQDLSGKIDVLTRSLEQTQSELAQSRTEIEQLRAMLGEVLKRMDGGTGASQPGANGQASVAPGGRTSTDVPQTAQISQDDWDMLNARVEEQHQTKVESNSKFRLKLSGIALFNAFDTSGRTDNLDVPSIGIPRFAGVPDGGLGATVRQSIIGLTGIGPEIFGARTSADLQMGFYGGLPSGYSATTSGIASLRIARMRFDWEHTSVTAGLDTPFFSPNTPTTYMSVAVPGFAAAGNLWTWAPTIRVQERFGGAGTPLMLEAGLLDPSSNINYNTNNNLRAASPSESSRIPTYAVRMSYNRKSEERPATVGVAAVYSAQEFAGGLRTGGWAVTTDWRLGVLPRTELSGQFFAGRDLDGFGGVPEDPYPVQNQFLYASLTARLLADVGMIGGWTQLKYKWNTRNEFNVAAGTGGRNSAGLRQALGASFPAPFLPARNEMMFANYIFRPRSDLVFSAEYRRIRTYEINGGPDIASQIGLALGFLF